MKQTTLPFILISSILTIGLVSTIWAEQPKQRWYTDNQVTQGKILYTEHCSKCHGENAEATPDWRKSDAKGNYPPPPLNGTAHSWHHPLPLLRLTIRNGGANIGGTMPPFDDKLSAKEIDSIIAWFQSLWPDEAYNRWISRRASQISKPR